MAKRKYQKINISKKLFLKSLKKWRPSFNLIDLKQGGEEILCLATDFFVNLIAIQGALIMPDSRSYYKMEQNRQEILKTISNWRFKKSINYLEKQKLINLKKGRNFSLTPKGYQKTISILTNNLKIKLPARWDGKWRMVIFDLPLSFAGNRNFLRYKLQEMGFINIQQSALIFPFPCKKEVNFLIELTETTPYIYFLTAKIQKDNKLIYNFTKAYPKQFRKFIKK